MNFKVRALAVVLLLAALGLGAGVRPVHATNGPCGAIPTGTPTVEPVSAMWQRTMTYGGLARSYYVYRPARVLACTAPLVLVLHGINTTALAFEAATLFSEEAEAQGFIAIFPESAAADNSWNVGYYGCCGLAAAKGIDDLGFMKAIVHQAESDYTIDPLRVYATGHSNGGFMSYSLGCNQASTFAAVAPVGAYPDLYCAPSRPVGVLHIHGDADPIVPYNGFVPAGMQMWQRLDTCVGAPTTTDSGGVKHTIYGDCSAGTGVELYVVHGMGHTWPAPWDVTDAGGMQLNGTDTVWQFFATHHRTAAYAWRTPLRF